MAVSFLGAAGSIFLLGSSLRQHWLDAKGSFPLEWLVIIGWNLIGLAMWIGARSARANLAAGEQERLIVGEH